MASSKKKKKYFDPRDFFPHMNAFDSDEAVPTIPTNFEEILREQGKAINPAYWMHMGNLLAQSSVSAPWLWYGMMLGTMEAMKGSSQSNKKIEQRHKQAVAAVHKFTKHVAGAKAVKPPKNSRKKKKTETGKSSIADAVAFTATNVSNALTEPLEGVADNLQMISGVGPKLEKTLNDLGVYHFGQIAKWGKSDIDWVDEYLKFSGRIVRENWIDQAEALAKGGRDEYFRIFGKEPR